MKCGLIALQVPFLQLDLPLQLDCGLELRGGVNVESPFWIEGLGKWKLGSLKECDLAVVASMVSERPEILDKEHSVLVEQAFRFVIALMLTGVKFNHSPVILKSSFVEDEEKLRSYSDGSPWRQTDNQPYTLVDRNRIAEAEAALVGINRVFGKVDDFRRFRKGLKSIMAGLHESSCDDRAYGFARALEATHATGKNEGRAAFVEKCQALCGQSPENQEFFEDLYAIRSNVVHVNGFPELVKAGETAKEAEERVTARCADAEIICKEVYRRILSDPELLDRFRDDGSIRSYWNANPAWEPPVSAALIRIRREKEINDSRF